MGLYDRLAKVFLYIAITLSHQPRKQAMQIIDDAVACGTKLQVTKFYRKYREVAGDCGVLQAPEEDLKKAFSATQEGEVFGVMYNTCTFTWWLREDKLGVIVQMLIMLEKEDTLKLGFAKSIVGKLIHYRMMVPNGKFYLGQLIRISKSGPKDSMEREFKMTDWARHEAWFW